MTDTGIIRYCLVCGAKRKLFANGGKPHWECGHLQAKEQRDAAVQ